MPDRKLHETIMKCVDEYSGKQGNRQPRYFLYPYPQRLSVLNDNLKVHMLREAGKIKEYLALQSEIFTLSPVKREQDVKTYEIMRWLDSHIEAVTDYGLENTAVVSMAAWGSYAEKALKYTLKSFMAEGNIPALVKEKNVIIHLQTDQKALFECSEIVNKMKGMGVRFEYAVIHDELKGMLTSPDIVYWMLGACASLALWFSIKNRAAFHHSYPDMVYSEKFFSELLRLSKEHKSILGPGMRSDESLIVPALNCYTNKDSISVPSQDLLALHMECLHLVSYPYLVNNRPGNWMYPLSHVMLWESEGHIRFNSPHLNAWWIDYSVIKDLPPRYYMTMDSEMDLICKGEDYYIPDEDDLYQVEISHPDRAMIRDVYGDAPQAARVMWSAITHRDTLKFFLRGMRLKINRTIRPVPANCIPESKINVECATLFNTILSQDPFPNDQFLKGRTHLGRLYG